MSTNSSAETEAPETTGGDGPLLDLTDAGVKKFIKQAKARGYVTMDELNKVLPSEEVTSEAIEDTLAMLSEMGVNVVEAEEDAEGSGRRRGRRPRGQPAGHHQREAGGL
jgi:RNA polymerase primary sigma factor